MLCTICGYKLGGIPSPLAPPILIPAIAAKPPKLPPTLLPEVCGTIIVLAVYSFGENSATNKPMAIKIRVVLITVRLPSQRVLASWIKSISSS